MQQIQGAQWIKTAHSRHAYFASSRRRQKYSLLERHDKETLPEPLQIHPSVFSFFTRYADLQLLGFGQDKRTGV